MPKRNPWGEAARYSAIILILPVCLLLGLLVGRWLDDRWSTGPTFSIVGFLLGIAVAAVEVHRLLKP